MAAPTMIHQAHNTLNASSQFTNQTYVAYQRPKERPVNTMAQLQTEYSTALANALTALVGGGVEGYAVHLKAFLATLASAYDTGKRDVAAFEIVTLCLLGQYDAACATISRTYPAAMDEDKYVACIGATGEAVRHLSLSSNIPGTHPVSELGDRRQSDPMLPQKIAASPQINKTRTPPPAYGAPLTVIHSIDVAGVPKQANARSATAVEQQRSPTPQARARSSPIVPQVQQTQIALPPPPQMPALSPLSAGGYNPATYGHYSPATAQMPQNAAIMPKRRPVGSPKPVQQTLIPEACPRQPSPQYTQSRQRLPQQPLPTPPYSPLATKQCAEMYTQSQQQVPQMYFPPPPPTPAKRTPSPGALNTRRAIQQRPQPTPQERPQPTPQQRPQPTPQQGRLHPAAATRLTPEHPRQVRQRAQSQQIGPARPSQMQQQHRPRNHSMPHPPGHLAAPIGPGGEKGYSGPPPPRTKKSAKAMSKIKNFHKTPAGRIAIRVGTGMAIASLTGGLIGGMDFGGGDVDVGADFESGDVDLGGDFGDDTGFDGEEFGGGEEFTGGDDYVGGEDYAGGEGYVADGAAFEDNVLYEDVGYEGYGGDEGAVMEDNMMYGEDAGYGAEGATFEDNLVAEDDAGGYADGSVYVEDQYAQNAGTYEESYDAGGAPTETATEDLPGQVGPCFEDNIILSAAAG